MIEHARAQPLTELSRPKTLSILKKCGSGSFGDVYVAETEDHQKCAVKLVERSSANLTKVKALCTEARALSRCKLLHIPHVIQIKDFSQKKSTEKNQVTKTYITLTTEFAEGGDLQSILNYRRLTEPEIKILGKQLLLAIQALHKAKIVHRDIKPANIVLNQGKWSLIDFGLAKMDEPPKTPCGTPYYEAPEVYYEREYTPEVDVWSIGVVLYQAFTGKHPFNATSSTELQQQKEMFLRGKFTLPFTSTTSDNLVHLIYSLLRPAKIRPTAKEALQHPFF